MTFDMTDVVTLLIASGDQPTVGDAAAMAAGRPAVPLHDKRRRQKILVGFQMQMSFLTGHLEPVMNAAVALRRRINMASASVATALTAPLLLLRRRVVVNHLMADQMAVTGHFPWRNDVVVG